MRYKWRKVQQCSKPAIKFSPLLSFSESLWPFKIKGKFENAQLHIWRITWQHMPSLPSLTTDERVLLHWKQSISTRICHSQKKSQKPPTLGKPLFNTSREPFRWKGHSDRRDNIKEQSDYWRNQLRCKRSISATSSSRINAGHPGRSRDPQLPFSLPSLPYFTVTKNVVYITKGVDSSFKNLV